MQGVLGKHPQGRVSVVWPPEEVERPGPQWPGTGSGGFSFSFLSQGSGWRGWVRSARGKALLVPSYFREVSCAARQRGLLNSCLSNWSPFSSLFRLFPGFVEQVRKSPLWCFPKPVRRIVHSKHEGLQGLVQWATPLLQGLQHQLGRGPQWVLDTLVGAALQADEPPVPYHGWVSRLHGETRRAAQTLWGSSQGPEGEGNPRLHRSTFLRTGLSCGQRRGQKGLSGMLGFFLLLHPQFGWSQSTTFGQGQEDLFAIKFSLQGKQIFLSFVKQTAWG